MPALYCQDSPERGKKKKSNVYLQKTQDTQKVMPRIFKENTTHTKSTIILSDKAISRLQKICFNVVTTISYAFSPSRPVKICSSKSDPLILLALLAETHHPPHHNDIHCLYSINVQEIK